MTNLDLTCDWETSLGWSGGRPRGYIRCGRQAKWWMPDGRTVCSTHRAVVTRRATRWGGDAPAFTAI